MDEAYRKLLGGLRMRGTADPAAAKAAGKTKKEATWVDVAPNAMHHQSMWVLLAKGLPSWPKREAGFAKVNRMMDKRGDEVFEFELHEEDTQRGRCGRLWLSGYGVLSGEKMKMLVTQSAEKHEELREKAGIEKWRVAACCSCTNQSGFKVLRSAISLGLFPSSTFRIAMKCRTSVTLCEIRIVGAEVPSESSPHSSTLLSAAASDQTFSMTSLREGCRGSSKQASSKRRYRRSDEQTAAAHAES